jgi:hypothetical protein
MAGTALLKKEIKKSIGGARDAEGEAVGSSAAGRSATWN